MQKVNGMGNEENRRGGEREQEGGGGKMGGERLSCCASYGGDGKERGSEKRSEKRGSCWGMAWGSRGIRLWKIRRTGRREGVFWGRGKRARFHLRKILCHCLIGFVLEIGRRINGWEIWGKFMRLEGKEWKGKEKEGRKKREEKKNLDPYK